MTRRERVVNALNFKPVDQIPKDLGGMPATGISAFAYPKLRKHLHLAAQTPRVYDIVQMLALPETDVLDALDCDVVTVDLNHFTNAFDEPQRWEKYNFNGRLDARVQNPSVFKTEKDGVITHKRGWTRGATYFMPKESYVFDEKPDEKGSDFLSGEIKKHNLKKIEQELNDDLLRDEEIKQIADYCRKVRESSDRAVFLNGLCTNIGFQIGIPEWSMLCLMEPEYIHAYQRLLIDHFCENVRNLLPEIKEYVDINMTAADDHGTQSSTILSLEQFNEFYLAYYKEANTVLKSIAPEVKSFLHCCGAIYPFIDSIIDCGFHILNPVQWTAGDKTYKQWKDKCRKRIALWGGGVDSQTLLPQGTVEKVEGQVKEVSTYLAQDSGYVFNPIHNILAEIDPEKIAKMYEL